jgi:hypothetical protein
MAELLSTPPASERMYGIGVRTGYAEVEAMRGLARLDQPALA